MVPGVGVEPTLPKEPDFESGASANSATRAHVRETRNVLECVEGKPEMMRIRQMPEVILVYGERNT